MYMYVSQVQEDYIKDELKNLRTEYLYAQEEVKRIQSVPLVIGQFLEAVDQNYAIVGEYSTLYMYSVSLSFVCCSILFQSMSKFC